MIQIRKYKMCVDKKEQSKFHKILSFNAKVTQNHMIYYFFQVTLGSRAKVKKKKLGTLAWESILLQDLCRISVRNKNTWYFEYQYTQRGGPAVHPYASLSLSLLSPAHLPSPLCSTGDGRGGNNDTIDQGVSCRVATFSEYQCR